jgi:hypothetical protein
MSGPFRESHPEAHAIDTQEYTAKQLAEIASEDPTWAAYLFTGYDEARNAGDAMAMGLKIEDDRADRLYPRNW